MVGILFSASILFCLVNFQVTRGSFLCAKVLKYYAIGLALICLPSLFIVDSSGKLYFSIINLMLLLRASYLISEKKYQNLIQFQKDFFDDLNEAKMAVEREMNQKPKQRKR